MNRIAYQAITGDNNEFHPDPRVLQMHGEYTSPVRTEIKGIETYIVDPHNEEFPFWMKKSRELGEPLIKLHIDDHADSCSGSLTFEKAQEKNSGLDLFNYAKQHLNIASFVSAEFYYKAIECMYWFNPRNDFLYALGLINPFNGDIVEKPRVIEDDGRIRFGLYEPLPLFYKVKFEEFIKAISHHKMSLGLDIDLDAFECIEDKDYKKRRKVSFGTRLSYYLGSKKRNERFRKTIGLLKKTPKPQLITIIRSQTPIATTPPESVNQIECRLYDELEKVYR